MNDRKPARLKSWYNVFQEDQMGKMWFDPEGEAYSEYESMISEESPEDKITMTGLDTSRHNL